MKGIFRVFSRKMESKKGKKILIVDDEEERRESFVHFFISKGHCVFSAKDAKEAISYIISKDIEVVIIKARLSGISGYDAAPMIKKINPKLRIIMTLNDDLNNDAGEANHVDFFEYFLEPLDLEEIEQAINESKEPTHGINQSNDNHRNSFRMGAIKWMIYIVVILVAVLGTAVVFPYPFNFMRRNTVTVKIRQPLQLNHKLHKEELDCIDCHEYVDIRANAGIPRIESCIECHEDTEDVERPEAKKAIEMLIEYARRGKELPWKVLYTLRDDIVFSHKVHVRFGKIECSDCHGKLGESAVLPTKIIVHSMERCMECHESKKANNDCLACHK